MVGRQNAYISDTLQLRDVAMATIFWDCISCKWTLTGDKDIRISYRDGLLSVNLKMDI